MLERAINLWTGVGKPCLVGTPNSTPGTLSNPYAWQEGGVLFLCWMMTRILPFQDVGSFIVRVSMLDPQRVPFSTGHRKSEAPPQIAPAAALPRCPGKELRWNPRLCFSNTGGPTLRTNQQGIKGKGEWSPARFGGKNTACQQWGISMF